MKSTNLKLAPKILILLSLVIFGMMTLYGIYQVKKIERSLTIDAEKNHILLLSNSVGVFAKSIWEFDKEIAKKGMEPLFEGGTVKNIRIYDVYGKLFSGLQFSKGIDDKKALTPISSEQFAYEDLKIGSPSKPNKEYNAQTSLVISPMENFPNEQHRLIASLWWKENPDSTPKFLGNTIMDFSTEYIGLRIHEQRVSFIFLAIALSIGILFLTFIFIQIKIISPIHILMQASLDVASGKFTRLKSLESKDEIGNLTDNFNHMVDRIEHSLILIRGISDASHEIVKCKTPGAVAEIYSNFTKKLIRAEKVEIWINSANESNSDASQFKSITSDKTSEESNLVFQKIIKTKDIITRTKDLNDDFLHVLAVPLLNSNNFLLGMVEIFSNHKEIGYSEEDVRIVKGLAVSLTTAIENYWHVLKEKDRANIERDAELAGAVQDSIITKSLPQSNKYSISSYYKTASQCGGDWYGVYELGENKVFVLFGDVTGHGTPAALITAVTRGAADMLNQIVLQDPKRINQDLPARSLEFINECIANTGNQTYYMTMVAAFIDFNNNTVSACSAGHTPPAFMIRNNIGQSEVKYIYPSNGSRLGFETGVKYETDSFNFLPGQQIVFYTDGIIEGENQAGKEYGLKRFKNSMETHGNLNPDEFIQCISEDAFKFFNGTPPKDDIALLVVKYLD